MSKTVNRKPRFKPEGKHKNVDKNVGKHRPLVKKSENKFQKSGNKFQKSENKFQKSGNKFQKSENNFQKNKNFISKRKPNSKQPWKSKYKKKEEDDGSDFEEVEDKVQAEETVDKDSSSESYDTSDDDEERKDVRKLVAQQNRKKKKSGGFQSMGLSHNIYKGIIRKGYKVPTPIQRKTVPIIMEGKDMVAMARTGSGKTAAFLIPMFEKLQTHCAKSGARGLILSPTRELAVQTLKFAKELGKFTGLRAAVVLGGDRMEDQFAALHENPDIIIATPGRFMHVVVEMNLKLKSVQYIVFDEADRLFEMGFQEQMNEILNRLPDSRQTLLFSATLPKLLVEFAKAGLHDPTLIRLDVDTKLSEQLKLSFLQCRADDKLSVLLYLLKHIIPAKEQTVVFAATKHHVQYINMILEQADIPSTYIYSSLDPTARKINIAKFQHRKVFVMIVTDLAARGIDIPLLDNVINFNFPAKGKLFIHRVGRVARAGRSGVAYSLIAPDETAYMFDLHVFLGRPVRYAPIGKSIKDEDGLLGRVPQTIIDDASESLLAWHARNHDIQSMVKVCTNAYGHYLRSRPAPASESVKRVKEMEKVGQQIGTHPLFGLEDGNLDAERQNVLNALKSYKSNTTIFEINSTAKTNSFSVMKKKRTRHQGVVQSKQRRMAEYNSSCKDAEAQQPVSQENANEIDVQNTFSLVIGGKRVQTDQSEERLTKKQKREQVNVRDEENYISYRPADFQSEEGLKLGSNFDREASGAMLDLTGDDEDNRRRKDNALKWDRKKKKFVRENNEDPKKKKIRTESGAWIPASYKSNAYKDWIQKTKRDTGVDNDDDEEDDDKEHKRGKQKANYNKNRGGQQMDQQTSSNRLMVYGGDTRKRHRKGAEDFSQGGKKNKFKNKRSELKRPEQIMKARKLKAKKEAFQNQRQKQNTKNRSMAKNKKK